MTSEEVAREFARLYPEILEYTKRAVWHFGVQINPYDVVAECYCHVHDHRDQISQGVPLEAIAKNWCKQNLIWTKSPLRAKLTRPVLEFTGPEPFTSWQHPAPEDILVAWKATLDSYQRRLWGIYGEQGLTKGREIAMHLGISNSSAYLLIKEAKALEQQLKIYIKDNI